MNRNDIEEAQERLNDIARIIHTLANRIEEFQEELDTLKSDLIEVESHAHDYADDCDTYNIPEGWEEAVELLPTKPSVGDVLALKELVAKWMRDTYGNF